MPLSADGGGVIDPGSVGGFGGAKPDPTPGDFTAGVGRTGVGMFGRTGGVPTRPDWIGGMGGNVVRGAGRPGAWGCAEATGATGEKRAGRVGGVWGGCGRGATGRGG